MTNKSIYTKKMKKKMNTNITIMKKTFIILFTALCVSSYAQNCFPTDNAIWNENIGAENYIYGLLGDTIFHDTFFYSKLYELKDTLLSEENIKSYRGALRNEGQKVWFKPANWTHSDILLYDFSVEVGDTIWHNASFHREYYNVIVPCPDCYSVVHSTKIENNRKTYSTYFSTFWYTTCYENIGSLNGILRSIITYYPMYMTLENFKLLCFKHNDTVQYLFNHQCENKCFCHKDTGLINNMGLEEMQIFPNPADGVLSIRVSNNELINSIEIIDMNGKTINHHCVNAEEFELNVSALNSAHYLIKIMTNKSIYTKKIIKR